MSYRNADYDDCPEADELRAEARERRWRLTPCCTCRGTLGSHVAGCPEDDAPPEPTECGDCDGSGVVKDWDDRIGREIFVQCDLCDGCGWFDADGKPVQREAT